MSYSFTAASSQYLEVPAAVPVSSTPLSMACWYKNTTTATTAEVYVSLCKGTDDSNYIWLGQNGGSRVQAQLSDGVAFNTPNSGSNFQADNVWQHAACVFASATSGIAYCNGGAGTTTTTSVTPSGIARASIGNLDRLTPIRYTNAKLAHVAIWNTALTAAEVAFLAAGGSPLVCQRASLVSYAKLVTNATPQPDTVWGSTWGLVNTPTYSSDDPTLVYPRPAQRPSVRSTSGLYVR